MKVKTLFKVRGNSLLEVLLTLLLFTLIILGAALQNLQGIRITQEAFDESQKIFR